tara:strand:+ start:37 stop:528 length:492 start_codon:yes stop_codon:yes gene_type:complete
MALTTLGVGAFPAGSIIQTVSLGTTSGITRLQTASTSYVATALSNSITPKFQNSKFNVRCAVSGNTNQTNGNIEGFYMTFFRKIGSGSFANIRATSNEHGIGQLYNTYSRTHAPMLLEIIDAPNTTSEVTYKLYLRTIGSAADVEVPPGTEEHVEFVIQEIKQ